MFATNSISQDGKQFPLDLWLKTTTVKAVSVWMNIFILGLWEASSLRWSNEISFSLRSNYWCSSVTEFRSQWSPEKPDEGILRNRFEPVWATVGIISDSERACASDTDRKRCTGAGSLWQPGVQTVYVRGFGKTPSSSSSFFCTIMLWIIFFYRGGCPREGISSTFLTRSQKWNCRSWSARPVTIRA